MVKYDWSRFCKRINIKCSLPKAYNAWATQTGLQQWFLRTAEFYQGNGKLRLPTNKVQKGDTYRWLWYGYSDAVAEEGKIIKANGKDLVQFSFSGNCLVSVTFKKRGKETIVELWQTRIPTNEKSKVNFHLACSTGWTFYLANLKSVLEGGLDLRNKDEKLTNVVNA